MDVLIPVALLIVGLIIGFFVARFMSSRDGASNSSKQAEQNLKELMSQQAVHHIHQTRQAIDSIEKQCQALKQQVADYETLLNQGDDEDAPSVPFYGEQATSYLRNNIQGREKTKPVTVAETQPRDFANVGSGLFVGSSGRSTAEKE